MVSFLNLPVLDANSPAKLYDALAVGTPVVVTNRGWTRELVERTGCGWYAPAGDAAALAGRLEELLARPEELRAVGQRGKALASQEFDRSRLAATMQDILENAAG